MADHPIEPEGATASMPTWRYATRVTGATDGDIRVLQKWLRFAGPHVIFDVSTLGDGRRLFQVSAPFTAEQEEAELVLRRWFGQRVDRVRVEASPDPSGRWEAFGDAELERLSDGLTADEVNYDNATLRRLSAEIERELGRRHA